MNWLSLFVVGKVVETAALYDGGKAVKIKPQFAGLVTIGAKSDVLSSQSSELFEYLYVQGGGKAVEVLIGLAVYFKCLASLC